MQLELAVALAVTAVMAAVVTLAGSRTERAIAAGTSRLGLVIGSFGGGGLIAGLDLLFAAGFVAIWDATVAPAIGAGQLPLLDAFVVIAVVHVWTTLALSRRRWAREHVPHDRLDR